MIDILLPLAILAVLCFLIYRIPHYLSSRSSGYLPTTRYHLSRPIPLPQGWTIDWTGGQLSLSTKDYNAVPRLLLGRWKRYQPAVTRFYALGGLAGIVGLFGSLGGAVWAVLQVWETVWEEFTAHSDSMASSALSKRSFVDLGEHVAKVMARRAAPAGLESAFSGGESLHMHSSGLSPLIPGITIPLSHLPTIILVLILCQLVHELGHALAASLDGISPSRFSLNIHYVLPSMTVSFSSSVDRLPASSRIRLAAAGAWHNLITVLVLGLLAFTRISRPLWTDTGAQGLVVDSVDFMSPLADHIHPGDLITHLDDNFVGRSGSLVDDQWEAHLKAAEIWDDSKGWCVSAEQWKGLLLPPCLVAGEISFRPAAQDPDSTTSPRCLPPHPILDSPTTACRCADGYICVRPALEERVLRIRLTGTASHPTGTGSHGSTHSAGERVVLWSGDRREVLDSVKVGHLSPRVFPGLLQWLIVFLNYVSTVSLSLYFFNLLPLSGTDGSHLLAYLFLLFPSGGANVPRRSSEDDLDTPLRAILHTPPRGASARSRSAKTRMNDVISDMDSDLEAGRYESGTDGDDTDADHIEHDRPRARASGRRGQQWKTWVRRGIEMMTLGLVGAWIGGWAMVALLRSS